MGETHPLTMLERPTQHSHLTMGGTHPTTMSERLQHLYITMGGTHPMTMSEKPAQHSHLTMGGTHPTTMSKRLNTYILPWKEHIQQPCKKGSAFTSDHVGKHPIVTSEWIFTYI